MKVFLLLLIFLSFGYPLAASSANPEKKIYFGIPFETSLPFSEVKSRYNKLEVTGGILKNLAYALFKEMGIKPVLVVLPKKRIAPELISGHLSVVCYASEDWYPSVKGQFYWSATLTKNTTIIAGINRKRVKKIEDLYGKNLGTIMNFIYQNLDPYFEKKLIRRDNGPSIESNIQKLLHGRIDYVALSNLEYAYYKKTYPQLEADDLNLDSTPVKCAISKKSGIDLTLLNKTIEKLRTTGELQKLFTP